MATSRRRNMSSDLCARGFTLIEVIVALTLGAVIVLGARELIENLASGATRIAAEARTISANANGEWFVRSLAGQIETGADESDYFSGDEQAVSFVSWCIAPDGWEERRHVKLVATRQGDTPVLLAQFEDGSSTTVVRATQLITLRYLVDAREGGSWFLRWGAGSTTPRAIGVIVDADTLILRIGDRG